MLKPEIGDTVVVELEVSFVRSDSFSYRMMSGANSDAILCSRITAIKPRQPKVGDTVYIHGAPSLVRTLLYIHDLDGRKFGVVAFMGDMPTSHPFAQLSLERLK